MTVTKKDLVELIYEELEVYPRRRVEDILETMLEIMKDSLADKEAVVISGFGKFVPVHKNKRPGRNPKTGEVIDIPEHYTVSFRPSPVLRKKLNS